MVRRCGHDGGSEMAAPSRRRGPNRRQAAPRTCEPVPGAADHLYLGAVPAARPPGSIPWKCCDRNEPLGTTNPTLYRRYLVRVPRHSGPPPSVRGLRRPGSEAPAKMSPSLTSCFGTAHAPVSQCEGPDICLTPREARGQSRVGFSSAVPSDTAAPWRPVGQALGGTHGLAFGIVCLVTWGALYIDGAAGARHELDRFRRPPGGRGPADPSTGHEPLGPGTHQPPGGAH